MKARIYSVGAFLLIFIVGFLCYSNSFDGAFVFDDLSTIVYSTGYLDGFASVEKIWLNQPLRFLPNLSFAVNYYLGGFNVIGFHLVNFFIHIAATYVVFLFTKLLVESGPVGNNYSKIAKLYIPIVASLLFLTHPIQTQAVAYITQRTASIVALFYVLSMVFYVKSAIIRKKQWKNKLSVLKFTVYYACAVASACLAMLSKENAFTLPLAILLVEYFFFTKRLYRMTKKLILLAPFILLAFYIYFSRGFTINFGSGIMGRISAFPVPTQKIEITRGQYLLTQANVVRTYVRLLFFPIGQNLDYDYPISRSIFDGNTILSSFVSVFLIIFAFLIFRKNRLISFGIFFFFTTLLVESSVIPLDDVIMEHRLYLPSVGFVLAVTASFFSIYTFLKHYLGKKKKRNLIHPRFFFISLIFLTIMFSSFLTYRRNKVWKDDYTLWKDVVSKSPNKSRPYFNLGMAYINRGDFANGVFQFRKAIEIEPKYWKAYNNIAAAYDALGDFKRAEETFKLALDIAPDNSFIRNNLADLYYRTGRINDAVDELNNGLLIAPADPSLYSNLGLLYYRQGEVDKAIEQFRKSLKFHPNTSESYYYLGVIEASQGRYDAAVDFFNKALELNPKFTPAIVDLGKIFLGKQKNKEALKLFTKALKIDPNSSEAFYHIGLLYLRQGSLDRAEDAFGLSTRKNPYFFQAFNNLGIVLVRRGKKDEARKAFERALELYPDYKKARNNLEMLTEE